MKNTRPTQYFPLPDNAARQLINSSTVFDEYVRVRAFSRKYEGGMYWKKQGEAYEYLVKTTPAGKQKRLQPRSPESERIYEEFLTQKAEVESRLKSLKDALNEAERLNKAMKVGRVPAMAISILQAIERAGLGEHFTVVGTHALYAYETAAGVRIIQDALATEDVDLLWDARRRVKFITDLANIDSSILKVLQKADSTFQRKEGQNETAINDKGFEVDFLRRMQEGADPHPFRFSKDENDLWPVQAMRASVLTNAPRFEHVVISATGRMTLMRTITPEAFVEFKRWMAEKAAHRPAVKRRRDALQADIVQRLIDDGLLLS